MKNGNWKVWIAAGLFVLSGRAVRAQETGTVKDDRVNVRAMASLVGEVVTQLKKGESVTILEEIAALKPKPGEPTRWLKIKMPPNTPVWVHSSHIDAAGKTVKPNKLNLRAGPGENYSVIGRLEKGAEVREIRLEGEWMEIETPEIAYAFVAADLITRSAAAPVTPPPITPTPVVKQVPPRTPQPTTQPPPTPPSLSNPTPALPGEQPATTVATPSIDPATTNNEPPPKRIVTRDGVVFRTSSIQAPAPFGIESAENGKALNYLSTAKLDIKLDNLKGRKIRVTGEELLDKRWQSVPVLEVETLRLID